MFIQTEQTPNPQTLKFLPGKVVMDDGTAFSNIEKQLTHHLQNVIDVDGLKECFWK